jgi:cytochrome d ubiquinol oxidase subunit II
MMDITFFQITWFVLWAVLWAVYFMLDGFVLGIGMLHYIVGKSNSEKRVLINTVGPVWDGNEVWLITAGGATFAAFPTTYALMFSYLYTPLLILLFALIIRGVSFEFRGKLDSEQWRSGWDLAIFLGSLLPALLFGVAFGNIFSGLPMDGSGYKGTFFSLLNPYGLLTGALFIMLFTVHGALYAAIKTTGELKARSQKTAERLWPILLVVAVAFLVHTAFATRLYDNFLAAPILLVIPSIAVAALIGMRFLMAKNLLHRAFSSSCLTIVMVISTGVAGLYPNLIPSSLDVKHSLTIFNSSSSLLTLKIMTVVALIFVPLVIAYKAWIYRIFREPISVADMLKDEEAY